MVMVMVMMVMVMLTDDDIEGNLLNMWDLEVGEDIWSVAATHHIVAGRVAPEYDHDDYDRIVMALIMNNMIRMKLIK